MNYQKKKKKKTKLERIKTANTFYDVYFHRLGNLNVLFRGFFVVVDKSAFKRFFLCSHTS